MNATETRKRSDKNPRRKRSYIINPVFQWKYTLLISGSVFFISTFMCVILFGALDAQLRARLVDPRASHMWENTLVMLFSAVSFSILTAGAVGFWSIFLTHRVAGPMYVLERYCREIIVGRLPTVRALRRKDEFKELHEIFRKAVETLRMRQQGDLDVLTETLTIARSSAEEHEKGHKHALEWRDTEPGNG